LSRLGLGALASPCLVFFALALVGAYGQSKQATGTAANNLKSARDFGPSPGFDPRKFGLYPVQLETWRGLVFAAVDRDFGAGRFLGSGGGAASRR